MANLSISISPSGNPTIKVGDSITFTLTASPSDLGDYSWSVRLPDHYDCISTTITSTNGNVAKVKVTALAMSSSGDEQFEIRCEAGGYYVNYPQLVYLTEEEDTVTGISISGPSSVTSGSTATFTATTTPSTAANRHVTWSVNYGGDYFTIQSQTDITTGGRCTIKAASVSSSHRCVITCESEDGAATSNAVFDVVPAPAPDPVYVTSINLSVSNDAPVAGETVTVYADCRPTNADNRGVNWSVVSGDAEMPSVVGTTSVQVGSDTPGTSVIRATAKDGGGATNTISITWGAATPATSIVLDGTEPMEGYYGKVTVMEGESVPLTATVLPEGTTDRLFATDSSLAFSGSVRQTGDNIGTNVYEVTVGGHSPGSGVLTLTAGSVAIEIWVEVTEATEYVTDIVFPYAFSTKFKPGENSGSITAQSRPISAAVRGLTATVVSGSDHAHIQALNTTDIGCTFQVVGDAVGTATVRVQAMDDGGYYEDIQFEIVDKYLSEGIHFSPLSGKYYINHPGYATVEGLEEETVIVTMVSGSDIANMTYTPEGVVTITGVSPGEITLRAVSSDTGQTAEVTYQISDEWPHDSVVNIKFYVGNYDNYQVLHMGWLIHGGNFSVDLQPELTWDGASTIPPYSSSTLIQDDPSGIGPHGLASEVGTRTVYMTDTETGETVMYVINVVYEGEWTKTIHFDANLPSGASLGDPCPDDITLYNTGEEKEVDLPDQVPSTEGYAFLYWDTRFSENVKENELSDENGIRWAGSPIVIIGEDVEVTLYAVWFPLDDWYTVEVAPGDVVAVTAELASGVGVDHDLPMTGMTDAERYPITMHSYGDLPDGLSVERNGSTVQTIEGYVIPSGTVSLVGTPETADQQVRLMSQDTRGIQVTYDIKVIEGPEIPDGEEGDFTLDANGGTFPNGMGRVTLTAVDGKYVLPDWSVVDRPGYRLTGWVGDYSGSADMGSEQSTRETWTAQWAADARDYDTDYLPHAAVRIYRSLTEYIDATYLQVQGGEVVAELAEMRPGMATMTLLNDYEISGHNLLASDCDLWSSGSDGPIRPGMYVRIDDIQSDGTLEYLMDGFITTIQPDAENVKVEVGDRMTFLGKAGSTYRRNFYGESRTEGLFDAGHDTTGLYADVSALPDGFSIDGEVYWDVRATLQKSGSTAQSVISSAGGSCTYTFDVSADRLEDVTLRVGFNGQYALDVYTFSGIVTFSSGGASVTRTIYYEITSTGSVQWHDFDFASLDMDVSGQATIKIVMEEMGGGRGYCNVYLQRGSGSGTLVYSDNTMQSTDITVSCILGTWAEVTDFGSPSGGKMYVTAIQGQNIEDESLWTPPYGRVRIPYITGSQSVLSIMESMAWALGMTPMPAQAQGADAELVMFRTGGGYALDYYQKLADVASESGRTRCFMVRGYTTPILVPSSRHRLSDTSHGHIHYGGDSVSGGIPFSEFAPSLTMKNRPNLVLVRGTMSEKGETESVPIMVAVEDPDSTEARFGMVVESVTADSQVNRLVDAASSAWATLEENDLDEWEGTVTIPGICRDMMAVSGAYAGSGEPLRVTDSRNGLSSVQVRARQLKLDYNACTTQITLTNHSIRYSSGIADTTAMAITSADVATGDNSTTLFNTQYVRVKTEQAQTILESGNVVTGRLGDDRPFQFQNVSILQLPSGRSILVATAPPDGDVHAQAERPYDVISVAINGGSRIPIRASVRPDYYAGQTLILNVDFPS